MNVARMATAGVVVCLLALSVNADDKKDYAKLIVGKWTATKADPGTLPEGTVVEFTKDGKIKIMAKMGDMEMTIDGTYKVEGDKFTMTIKFGDQESTQTINIKKIDDKEMHTTDKGGKIVNLTKK